MPPEIFEFRVTPTLSTSPAYTSGDVLYDTTFLQNFIKKGYVRSIQLLDKDAQSETGTVIFFKNLVSLGTINAAISITDADAENIIGFVTLPASTQFVNSRINYTQTEMPFNIEGGTGLYIAQFTGSAGTHTASGIVMSICIERRDH